MACHALGRAKAAPACGAPVSASVRPHMEPPTPSAKPVPTPRGSHISRGVTLRIPAGGLVVHHGGEDAPRMEIAAVEQNLDEPLWQLLSAGTRNML
jgi:hypothetical protein